MKDDNLTTDKNIKEKSESNVINTENIIKRKDKPSKSLIILLIFNIIFILLICFLLFYFLKIKSVQYTEKIIIKNENITSNDYPKNDLIKNIEPKKRK